MYGRSRRAGQWSNGERGACWAPRRGEIFFWLRGRESQTTQTTSPSETWYERGCSTEKQGRSGEAGEQIVANQKSRAKL
ncbi:hypothetical protein H112_07624, partial [Trichophyton rubrum D6]